MTAHHECRPVSRRLERRSKCVGFMGSVERDELGLLNLQRPKGNGIQGLGSKIFSADKFGTTMNLLEKATLRHAPCHEKPDYRVRFFAW